jgi:hypothetical protein
VIGDKIMMLIMTLIMMKCTIFRSVHEIETARRPSIHVSISAHFSIFVPGQAGVATLTNPQQNIPGYILGYPGVYLG